MEGLLIKFWTMYLVKFKVAVTYQVNLLLAESPNPAEKKKTKPGIQCFVYIICVLVPCYDLRLCLEEYFEVYHSLINC